MTEAVNNNQLFKNFLETGDAVWIYLAGKLRFRSTEKGVRPLLTYIQESAPCPEGAIVFDRVVGNAAALLLKQASCSRVYSAIGSKFAAQTLADFGISHYFLKTTPHILNRSGNDICPFEKASIGKSAEEFYRYVRQKLNSEEEKTDPTAKPEN